MAPSFSEVDMTNEEFEKIAADIFNSEWNQIPFKQIVIPENRQRRDFDQEKLMELAISIQKNGLFHPLVLRKNQFGQMLLVAGERRLKAIELIWGLGQTFKYNDLEVPEGYIPFNYLGELDPIDAYEAELEENIRRIDLTWQEKATATEKLFELRRMQAQNRNEAPPSIETLSTEISGNVQDTRARILVAKHLNDPDVAKAKSLTDGLKILKRKEELKRSADLAEEIGATFHAGVHKLLKGNCIEILATLPAFSVDVVLTDPPYGMNAQDFSDSGGKAAGGHFYDDSPEEWIRLMKGFLPEICRVTKAQAHLYMFCDIDNFYHAKQLMLWSAMETKTNWRVFRTPLIWFNSQGMRAPWPEHGPQRKYQICLYAVKGDKPTLKLSGDIIQSGVDPNLNHQAQKPVALYKELLSRSCRPGDVVLDPFCGTGTIFPAAHELKCLATGIELDEAAFGIAAKRLETL